MIPYGERLNEFYEVDAYLHGLLRLDSGYNDFIDHASEDAVPRLDVADQAEALLLLVRGRRGLERARQAILGALATMQQGTFSEITVLDYYDRVIHQHSEPDDLQVPDLAAVKRGQDAVDSWFDDMYDWLDAHRLISHPQS